LKKHTLLFFILLSFLGAPAWSLEIPKGLSGGDQEDLIKILGLGTAVKMASNPYPLGGYSGFEIGMDVNFINVDQLSRLGCEPGSSGCPNNARSDEQEFSYAKITLGKGLYENVDLFLSFSPFISGDSFSDFGGSLRWTFYEARLLPIHLLVLLSGNQVNFENKFTSQNLSVDLLAGINVDDVSVYFGGGQIRSKGTFTGGNSDDGTISPGDPSLDAATNTATHVVHRFHTVVGASLEWKPLFIAGEINRYEDSVYTLKAGIRY
jgi:hypothetical protein